MTKDNRDGPDGMLIDVDRAWLRGEKEYGHRQQRYDRRQKIRQRVRNTFLDFAFLFEHLDRSDREQLFLEFFEDSDAQEALALTLGFVYLAQDRVPVWFRFKPLLQQGVRCAERKLAAENRSGDGGDDMPEPFIDVEFDVHRVDPFEIDYADVAQKLEAGEWSEISDAEAHWFLRMYSSAEEFDPEVPQRQLREWSPDTED